MANGNYTYCPIAGSFCTKLCRFYGEEGRTCLIETALRNLADAADYFSFNQEMEEVERLNGGKQKGGDTPEPHETKQKGD